jgi:hypothetical protein
VTKKREEPVRAGPKFDKERSIEIAMAHYRKQQEAISRRTKELRELRLRHEAKHGRARSRLAAASPQGRAADHSQTGWKTRRSPAGRRED